MVCKSMACEKKKERGQYMNKKREENPFADHLIAT